jgi:hypothetical protein
MSDPSTSQEHKSRSSSIWGYVILFLAVVLCAVIVVFMLGHQVNTTFSNVQSAIPAGSPVTPLTVPDPDELQRIPDPDEIERKFER